MPTVFGRGALRLLAGVAWAAGVVAATAPAHAATSTVSVGDGGGEFSPVQVTVGVDDSVRWSNRSIATRHNISSSGGDWSLNADVHPVVSTGPSSTSYTFRAAGTYTYVCRFHGTTGTVVVSGGTQTPTQAPRPSATARPAPAPTSAAPPSPSATPTSARTSPTPKPAASVKSPKPARTLAGPRRPARRTPAARAATRRSGLLRGLTADPTGRGRGLPVLVALVAVVGVGTAQLRVVRDLRSSSGRHRLSSRCR